jgi:hypothetical protein
MPIAEAKHFRDAAQTSTRGCSARVSFGVETPKMIDGGEELR